MHFFTSVFYCFIRTKPGKDRNQVSEGTAPVSVSSVLHFACFNSLCPR